MPKILLIEDDIAIAEAIVTGLSQEHFLVEWFGDAKLGKMALQNETFDAVLLDLTLPNGDGMTVLSDWRQGGIDTPVLIITARDAIANKVAGLNAGADDYLVKPFALDELVARLQALIRRSQGRSYAQIVYGKLTLDLTTKEVRYDNNVLDLTAKELAVLEEMLANPRQIHSRAALEDKLYSWSSDIDSNTIEVHIHHLRKKIANDFILTKRGIGYYLNPQFNHHK